MAFLRNYSSETASQGIHDVMSQGLSISRVHSLVGNRYIDGSSSEKDLGPNCQYQSDVGFASPSGLEDEVAIGDGHPATRTSNMLKPSGRKTTLVGKWGSNVWKDCQPMCPQIGSECGLYMENGFNARNTNRFEDNVSDGVSENDIDHKEGSIVHRGQTDVPEDEMLSDDYYEQDGYDQNGVLHHNGLSNSLVTSRRPTSSTVLKNVQRKSKESSHSLAYEISDDDADNEDEDYDEGDEDDPDDLDFEPDYGGVGSHAGKQGNDWDDEESDDEDNTYDDLELLDEDYVSSTKKSNDRPRVSSVRTVKSSKEHKPFASRRKKERASFDGDEMSAKDSDYDSDQDFRNLTSRGVQSQRNNGLRTSALANTSSWNSEVRTSSRSLRKVSYVESEESEDHDEIIKKKNCQKEEFEEEDGDSIEKVLWHQPRGMAGDALQQNKSANPVLLRQLFDTEPDWNEMEFFIKWKGQSHLHCQWKSFYDLQNLSGFKKVLNYTKKVLEDMKHRHLVSREEIEVIDVSKEMDLDLIKQNCQVERIIADRINKECLGDVTPEYLVKWQGLSYAEATWEKDVDITFAQDAIDEYKAREAAGTAQGKMVDLQRRKSRASLRKLDEQPMWLKAGQLRDYQLDGLNFLVNSWRNDTNVILADEMGLGKTVQAVSMLGFLQNAQQIHGPFLVVVPLSTLSNWAKEFRKWLPEMNVIVYVGTRSSREVCQQFEFYTNKQTSRAIKFDALLTTYEVVLKDKAVLSKIKWNYLMVDEAHRLKNSEAQLYTALLEFSTKNKLLITGTPLQNSVEELWALLHFLDHEKFKSKDDFVRNYRNLSSVNENQLANLHMELRPHILRRVIKDVEKSLPPKIERILRVEMSPLQKQYYKWILERNFRDLNKGVRGNQVSLLNIVVELKKCCNHPFLFESADYGYGGNSNTIASSKLERLILSSGKLVILDKLLVRLRTTNHRVLIFSQMVRMLDILADYMSLRGFQYQRLDGSTKAELRQQAMDHFNLAGSDDFCFLLSTRAGGLGINLATADTVIIFDSDWNPQNDLQAMSRAHRIGQREVVNIYRFVTSKSVEEDILERAKKKMVLDHLVIQKLNAEGRLEKKEAKKGAFFDKNELSAILRFGAEDLFKEERNDEESKKRLLSMDIDEILERAEKVEEKDAGVEQGSELLNAFKVANFSTGEDDGGFWSRLIKPDVISQADEALVPRAARNTKSYVETTQIDTQIDRGSKRKKMSLEPLDKFQKRRKAEFTVHSAPMVDGAIAQVRVWSHGNLSKRDALRFVRAAKKIGNSSQIGLIVSEVGGAVESAPRDAQIELFDILVDGCKEAMEGYSVDLVSKVAILDFFGVPVKANDLLTRIHELQLLAKRINRYKDPLAQYRVLVYLKPSNWSKGCGWNQIDDARLLLGIYYHGFGNWEKMRLDERLGLRKKIAPVELQHHETFLPRAPNLNERASALLEMECAAVTGNALNVKSSRKGQKKREIPSTNNSVCLKDNKVRLGSSKPNVQMNRERQRRMQKATEPLAKEEGELSDTGELYEQFKEVKWMEWCEDVMGDEIKTLNRLHRLQTTSADLPKEKVLARIRKYLQHLGQRIDEIVLEHLDEPYKQHRMAMRLWKYVSTFSNLSGEGLQQIYSKLKLEHGAAEAAPTQINGSTMRPIYRDGDFARCFERPTRPYKNGTPFQKKSQPFPKGDDNGKFEAWKRRRRADSQTQPQQHLNHKPSSELGILGSVPSVRCFGSERPFRAAH